MRMLDLFAGRLGWSKAFLSRGWKVTAVDLVRPKEIPEGVMFFPTDVLDWTAEDVAKFDFVCASSPCEQFSVFGMKCFHPNPPYPELGIQLFNHTRQICESAGVPYVMENVRAAQRFVGNAVHHCGSFYLWGSAVPPLLNQGIRKGLNLRNASGPYSSPTARSINGKHSSSKDTANIATIPQELANCVADYAKRFIEQRAAVEVH